jgi:hypothetical protein
MNKPFTPLELLLIAQLAGRHTSPKSTVDHPKGVIVPGDAFMTEKIKDPDYTPYCMRCTVCYRLHRTVTGFECPNCGTKSNFDLTTFNGNINVQYEET